MALRYARYCNIPRHKIRFIPVDDERVRAAKLAGYSGLSPEQLIGFFTREEESRLATTEEFLVGAEELDEETYIIR